MKEKVKETVQKIMGNEKAKAILSEARSMYQKGKLSFEQASKWAAERIVPILKGVVLPALVLACALLLANLLGWAVIKTATMLLLLGLSVGTLAAIYFVYECMKSTFDTHTVPSAPVEEPAVATA